MLFVTKTEEQDEPTTRPAAAAPEVHQLTPDPWMNWHDDPWSGGRAQPNQHSFIEVPSLPTIIPGVWPPPQVDSFVDSVMPQPTAKYGEVRVGPFVDASLRSARHDADVTQY